MKSFTHLKRLCLLLITFALLSCKNTELNVANSRPAHHTDTGFRNLYIEPIDKGPFTFMKMKYFGDEPFADQEQQAHQVPIAKPDMATLAMPNKQPQITWLGHSTFLIQHQGINILTDPILSQRASLVDFAGPKRLVALPIRYQDLPPIDYVIISHNHYDHLDARSIELLGNAPIYLVPLRLKNWFIGEGIDPARILEFDWWDSMAMKGMTATATPSQHWSARGLFDRFETLWAAWHLQLDDFSLWFAGDTGYNATQFKEIGQRWQNIDIALIPIGAYGPRWFMEAQHVDPEQAVRIHNDVGARLSIGMHWGTFQLTSEPILEPVQRLDAAVNSGMLSSGNFITLAIGETLHYQRQRDQNPITTRIAQKETNTLSGGNAEASAFGTFGE